MLMFPARVKACLVNQRFQENDALWSDWRLVLVHQAIPKLPKITLEGSIMRVFSHRRAIYHRVNQESFSSYAQMETLLVKAHNGNDEAEFSFVMRHTAKMLIQGGYLSN